MDPYYTVFIFNIIIIIIIIIILIIIAANIPYEECKLIIYAKS
jgi:uncharacterized membrane protein YhaH (DUF805 family)